MITIPDLNMALLDLLHEIKGTEIKFIIGGGLGIYFKTSHVRKHGMRTLLHEWPETRSTNDIDLFLRPELLIQSEKLKPMADAIVRLGYQVVPGAEKYQFVKPGPPGFPSGTIKIDILTGPQNHFHDTKVKVDNRRAKPKPSIGIHAHPVNEAPTLEKGLFPIFLEGKLGTGKPWQAEIFLPNPYTFLMMKLFAFKDRISDADKEFGRYHALDLYTILATTTEMDWRNAINIRNQHLEEPCIRKAGLLVSEYFSEINRPGMIRLRESPYFRPELQLDEFMSALQELFPPEPDLIL